MYNRYADIEKFVTDPDELQIANGSEVYISSEDNYDIVVDLQGHTEDFEQLKPFISFVAKNICELDNIAQKFDNLHSKSSQFPYVVAVVFVDNPYVILHDALPIYTGEQKKTRSSMWFLNTTTRSFS